jgi:hypothetical protein
VSRSQGRFVFTQFSAIVAFLVTVGIVVLLLGRVVDLESWARERPSSEMQVLGVSVACAAIGCVGILGMVLWGKLLVVIGLLTKEEARGYPYSKPWQH